MTTQSTVNKLVSNFPSLVAIFIIVVIFAGYFLVGSSPYQALPVNLRNMVSLSYPFALIASVVITSQVHINRIRKREFFGSTIFFFFLLYQIIVGLALGSFSDYYTAVWDMVYMHGVVAIMTMCGFALVIMTLRDLRPKSWAYGYMIVLAVTAFLAMSPLGNMIWPGFTDIGLWFLIYPGAVGVQMLWLGLYMERRC